MILAILRYLGESPPSQCHLLNHAMGNSQGHHWAKSHNLWNLTSRFVLQYFWWILRCTNTSKMVARNRGRRRPRWTPPSSSPHSSKISSWRALTRWSWSEEEENLKGTMMMAIYLWRGEPDQGRRGGGSPRRWCSGRCPCQHQTSQPATIIIIGKVAVAVLIYIRNQRTGFNLKMVKLFPGETTFSFSTWSPSKLEKSFSNGNQIKTRSNLKSCRSSI